MTLVLAIAFAGSFTWLALSRNRLFEPLLFGALLASAALALSLEALTLAGAMTIGAVRSAFIGAIAAAAAIAFALRRALPPADPRIAAGMDRRPLDLAVIGLSAAVVFVLLAATAVTALSAISATEDSMAYHLPRIEHWIQNGGLGFYPTDILRQLDSQVLAEELILAFRSLHAGYRTANLVQWLAFAGCIAVAARIAAQLGGARVAECLAAVIAATLPMALLQASSTQNDLVVAFFALASVHYLIRVGVGGRPALLYGAILAAGLAFHAKGTAAILLFGFVVIFGGRLLLAARSARFWGHAVIATAVAVLIVAGHLHRNHEAFGSPIGPRSAATSTEGPTAGSTLYNIVRNVASNAGPNVDALAVVDWAGRALGVADTDPRYSFNGHPFRNAEGSAMRREERAGNPWHVLLFAAVFLGATIAAALSRTWRCRLRPLLPYAAATLLSLLAFAALLKWQPWITRLQVGAFMLATPVVAVAIGYLAWATPILVVLLALQAWPPAFLNASRPLLGKHAIRTPQEGEARFAAGLRPGYVQLADRIAALRPTEIGLVTTEISPEFPLWYLLRQRLPPSAMPRITGAAEDSGPDVVVFIDRPVPEPLRQTGSVTQYGDTALYLYEQRPAPQQ